MSNVYIYNNLNLYIDNFIDTWEKIIKISSQYSNNSFRRFFYYRQMSLENFELLENYLTSTLDYFKKISIIGDENPKRQIIHIGNSNKEIIEKILELKNFFIDYKKKENDSLLKIDIKFDKKNKLVIYLYDFHEALIEIRQNKQKNYEYIYNYYSDKIKYLSETKSYSSFNEPDIIIYKIFIYTLFIKKILFSDIFDPECCHEHNEKFIYKEKNKLVYKDIQFKELNLEELKKFNFCLVKINKYLQRLNSLFKENDISNENMFKILNILKTKNRLGDSLFSIFSPEILFQGCDISILFSMQTDKLYINNFFEIENKLTKNLIEKTLDKTLTLRTVEEINQEMYKKKYDQQNLI